VAHPGPRHVVPNVPGMPDQRPAMVRVAWPGRQAKVRIATTGGRTAMRVASIV
jgi:hypothetical protein